MEKYTSKPLDSIDKKLQEKFAEDIANQATLMDNMGKQLLTLELAMVGIYATVLKLIAGDGATLDGSWAIGITFLFWFMAVVATVLAIFPEEYEVNKTKPDEIEKYFYASARKKGKMLVVSVALFFIGVAISVFTMI
ncbi:MAG: Unknown protein [uncultured Sulfurovum sp.]|uniref:Uncharacterized protein n=1 Tax=uncultured Sulfurovum sp. TaxID=269237 RepID=A0A6S6SL22_9BACT|nr:MAG: Unknown protein [uncultured Sulfurovum sp.]